MVILDTNIVIDHLRQPPEKSKLVKLFENYPDERFGLSLISIQELYEGKSTKDEGKLEYLLTSLTQIEILPYSYEVAKRAGEIARDSSIPIDLADAAIAATAIHNGATLYTLDKGDFRGIKELELYTS